MTNNSGSRTSLVVGTMSVGLALALIADSLFAPAAATPSATPVATPVAEVTPPPSAPIVPHGEAEDEPAPPSPADVRARCLEAYRTKQTTERASEEREAVREINRDAYTGGDVRAERRVYLLGQAYKRSRRATPVVFPVVPELPREEDSDTEELLDALAALDARSG